MTKFVQTKFVLTEEYRATLDGRGIAWVQPKAFGEGITVVRAGGTKWIVTELEHLGEDGTMHHKLVAKTEPLASAEQAVAATVGPACEMDCWGTGEEIERDCEEHFMTCLRCNNTFLIAQENEDGDMWCDEKPRCCPFCRAEVKGGGRDVPED